MSDDLFSDDDFNRLITNKTSWFTIDELQLTGNDKPLELELRFMGEGNEDAERLRNNNAFKARAKADEEAAAREVLAHTGIVSWRNGPVKDGKPVPYTPAAGVQLLEKLIAVKRSNIIARIIAHCYTATNFTTPYVDAGELGKG